MAWSEEEIEQVRHMWIDLGMPAHQIAAQTRHSRSAILGIMHRKGYGRRQQYRSRGEAFEAVVDLVANAPLNQPVTVGAAAQRVGMKVDLALVMWAQLCADMGRQATPGDTFRVIAE